MVIVFVYVGLLFGHTVAYKTKNCLFVSFPLSWLHLLVLLLR